MKRDAPTEAILTDTSDLDRRSVEEIVAAIHAQDRAAFEAVGKVLGAVAQAADVLVCVLAGGGSWFNVGAGTSGRMGALDAAEIPPTFGLPPGRVQGLIAGGARALGRAVEGAEDDPNAAAWELRERGLRSGDAVVAISASGTTPYVLGSLEVAHAAGARTIAITCDPSSPLAEGAEIAIAPLVGPEVIAGSTRMKGGLAQKMVLHTLSTSVMVKLGYVSGNLMTNVVPSSRKLRRRAEGLIASLGGVTPERAAELLDACHGSVRAAVERARGGVDDPA
jgi:N-acetylmuramic acid 6-phosphate etherase